MDCRKPSRGSIDPWRKESLLCCSQYRSVKNEEAQAKEKLVWQDGANSVCWHCSYDIKEEKWPLPLEHDSKTDTFVFTGSFCSAGCAASWASVHCRHNAEHCFMMLNLYGYKTRANYNGFNIAPPAHWLQKFGGPLSIDEFRQHGRLNQTKQGTSRFSTQMVEERPPLICQPIVLRKACDELIEEAKKASKQVKQQNKKATVVADSTTENRGLYHEFLENNTQLPDNSTTTTKKKSTKRKAQSQAAGSNTLIGLVKRSK